MRRTKNRKITKNRRAKNEHNIGMNSMGKLNKYIFVFGSLVRYPTYVLRLNSILYNTINKNEEQKTIDSDGQAD